MYAEDDQLDKQLRSTMFSLSGTGFFGAIGRSINLGKHNFVLHVYCLSWVRFEMFIVYGLNIRWSNCFSIEITFGRVFIKDLFGYWSPFWWWGSFKLFYIYRFWKLNSFWLKKQCLLCSSVLLVKYRKKLVHK